MCDVEKAIKSHQGADNQDAEDDDEEQQEQAERQQLQQQQRQRQQSGVGSQRCLSQLLKLLFSAPGLVLLVACYAVLGALIFPLLEAPQDLSKSAAIAKSREDCLRELWIITEKLNVLYERNWTMLVHEQLRRFEGSIVAATRPGSAAAVAQGQGNALGYFGYDAGDAHSWSFSEALLYSLTVITTIGHGSLTPRTSAGKLATIFYALFGVPLMLMCLSSLGALLAEGLQCLYLRVCCQLQRVQQKQKLGHATQQRRGANCKGCKYDAAQSETSLNDCYDYEQKLTTATTTTTTTTLKQEDACQLLRTAMPSKLNQQQQQQQQQQQPDVMLMTTTTAAGNTLLKYAPLPQQQQQQQQQQQSMHYINATQQQQLSTATLPRQHAQNFVAVPSSMLRFNAAPAALPLGAPPNCYAPATATIYFPFAPTAAAVAAAAATTGQQPLVKYHTIHLQPAAKQQQQQQQQHCLLTTLDAAPTAATAMQHNAELTATTLESITLPPPPAYQTNNMHAVRRAKLLTKPLAHEINTHQFASVAATGSSDLTNRHDLLPHALSTTATGTATTTAAAATTQSPQLSTGIKTTATMGDNSFMAAGVCGSGHAATAATAPTTAAATLSALLSSTGHVDIMEDEDEHERERSSNCAHGTPSRVPLIASTALSLPHELPPAEKSAQQARGLLQPLNRKTLLLTRRCQKHATLYANAETSDDEEYMQHGSEQFVLKKLRHNCTGAGAANAQECLDDCQQCEDVDDDDAELLQQQVPISLVLLILMCYICVGTVAFALWENWSLVDGAYFCFVTLSTIGYGDFVPTRSFNGPELQLYACCAYLLLGLVLVAMSFSILETQLMWKCKRIAVRLKLTRAGD